MGIYGVFGGDFDYTSFLVEGLVSRAAMLREQAGRLPQGDINVQRKLALAEGLEAEAEALGKEGLVSSLYNSEGEF